MKKLFLLPVFISCISFFTALAQPVLTSSTAPKIGDIVKVNNADATGLLPGEAGTNQTWDFSTVTGTGSFTINYMAPANTPYSSYYPLANLASTDGNGNYAYFNISSNEQDSLGAADSAEHLCYADNEKTFSYPITYNDSFTDTFSGTGNSAYNFNRRGTITIKADGYGTLKTPVGTFNNVLRISRKEDIIDTFYTLYAKYTYANQTYLWYIEGFCNSLFTLSFDTTYFMQSEQVTPVAFYATNAPNGVSDIAPAISLNVFPNPATDKIYLTTDRAINHVTLSNVLGQNVIDMQPEKGAAYNPVELSVAGLPAGIYFCNITTPAGNAARQIVKE